MNNAVYYKKKIKQVMKKMLGNIKTKNIIIMESRPDYTDNTKRVYDYLVEKGLDKKYKIIWLVENEKNFKNKKKKNVKFIKMTNNILKFYYIVRAKYIINCNKAITKINKNTIAINLWHGTLLKSLKDMRCVREEDIDYCLCPAEFFLDIYERELHVPKEKLLIMNNPRNDYLFSERIKLEEYFEKKYSKYIIWMPTFRKSKIEKNIDRIDSDYNFNKGVPIIKTEEDIIKLNNTLKAHKTLLVIKPHFAQDMTMFKLTECTNIKIVYSEDLIEKNIELYEFLGRFDALITDYSSVYFDYLIINKPIAFTIDDIENYKGHRGMVFKNPMDYMPGFKILNIEHFIKFIQDLSEGNDQYIEEREKICKLTNKYIDSNNTERIVQFLKI